MITKQAPYLLLIILLSGLLLQACSDAVPGKELIRFVKDGANGYTKTFQTSIGSEWTITLAPAEYMALNTIKKNAPDEKEYEETRLQYSDLSYFIIHTVDETRIPTLPCEKSLWAGCKAPDYAAVLCQEITAMHPQNTREYMVAFPKELMECNDINLFLKIPETGQFEKIGALQTNQLKTLPTVTTR